MLSQRFKVSPTKFYICSHLSHACYMLCPLIILKLIKPVSSGNATNYEAIRYVAHSTLLDQTGLANFNPQEGHIIRYGLA